MATYGEPKSSATLIHRLRRYGRYTLGVKKLRIQIDAALPFDCVEGDMHTLEGVGILKRPKHAEIKHSFHVEHASFAVLENDCQRVVVERQNLFHCRIH